MNGFVHQEGTQLYDGSGNPLLLRGVGLGNWLLPEGYMWHFFTKCDRPRRIEKLIVDLLGEAAANKFWQQYYSSYITREDIEFIQFCGLNSIRLPLNARHLMDRYGEKRRLCEEGIKYIDRLLTWCAEFSVYVILDMHAAPGGQTGTNIDDSLDDRPILFECETYRQDTIWLWRQLAERYASNTYIAGFDLLNEPLPNWFSKHNHKVLPLYRDIADAIREVDSNHLIILEGVHWATDWSIFHPLKTKPIDNCMLQFHKYWNNPDTESLQKYLDMRDQLGYPIYMGEGGENNLAWYAGMFHLLEQHNISWNFWSYKKLDTHNSPISIRPPECWHKLMDFINGGEKPTDAGSILKEFLHNIHFENCFINHNVLHHVQRQAPIQVSAIYYDLIRKSNLAKVQAPQFVIPFRQSDGVDFRFAISKTGKLCFKHYGGEDLEDSQRICLVIKEGEHFQYSFSATGEQISVYCRSRNNGCIEMHVNGRGLGRYSALKNTMHILRTGKADTGNNVLDITTVSGEVEVEWIQIG